MKIYAKLSLAYNALKDVMEKGSRPEVKPELVVELINADGFSKRQACATIRLSRSTYRYRRRPDKNSRIIGGLGKHVEK